MPAFWNRTLFWGITYRQAGDVLLYYGITIFFYDIALPISQLLNPKQFIRVHRSAMINIHFVREIQKHISSYDVIMQNGDVVRVSRSYMDRIRELTF